MKRSVMAFSLFTILLGLALLTQASSAHAAQWLQVAKSIDGIIYLDVTSFKDMSIAAIPVRQFEVKVLRKNNEKLYGQAVWFTLETWAIACDARKARTNESIYYDRKNRIINSFANPDPNILYDMPAQSVSEQIYGHVCTNVSSYN